MICHQADVKVRNSILIILLFIENKLKTVENKIQFENIHQGGKRDTPVNLSKTFKEYTYLLRGNRPSAHRYD